MVNDKKQDQNLNEQEQTSLNLDSKLNISQVNKNRERMRMLEDRIFKTDNKILKLKQQRAQLEDNKKQFDRYTSENNLVYNSEALSNSNLSSSVSKKKASQEENPSNPDIKSLKISIDIERMLRDEKAKAFIKKLKQKEKGRIEKVREEQKKEKNEWQIELYKRKEVFLKAKERINKERNEMSSLNKDFIKFQQYKQYRNYNDSLKNSGVYLTKERGNAGKEVHFSGNSNINSNSNREEGIIHRETMRQDLSRINDETQGEDLERREYLLSKIKKK
eukprot:CAMPEP_0170528052 /NCGR_PEP_ID=MMETSP0209-20121228/13552_1 /TAXON_ID=665100 ORGANISM="Litonotus pictus, Strain P1" /NCGR_SAMPLE_ID=MMETSP0209 /ASSEMBLY_ACC=CAM_ASM_000301 /LENGTH=275 /DNA_ID=CAMNT_0010819025 /DNA_START=72 /DNA_END=899 /DNA_ORIENTATION=+